MKSKTVGTNSQRMRRGGMLLAGAIAASCVLPTAGAHAGAVISFGDDKSISIGFGLRTSFTSLSYGAPDGKSRSADFNLDSIRLYLGGSLNKYIKGTFNTERASDGTINVLDGYGQFEFADWINLWVGRMLPPSDRSNLDGPYYLNDWLFPGIVSQYPAKFAGRDDGATLWGKPFDKKLVYSFGVFEGHNRVTGASNQSDNVLFAGRVAYNFWDPEPDPAYYTSSTYYGSVNVLTLAVAGMFQKDGVGTAGLKGDYKSWNIDGLFEKNLADIGVVTLEGAYYQYNTGGVADVATNFNGAGSTANVGGLTQGRAYLADGAFLFPQTIGWGKFQPVARYQEFDASLTHTSTRQYDMGVNYVIDGHNARVTADYAIIQQSGKKENNEIVLGVQLQY